MLKPFSKMFRPDRSARQGRTGFVYTPKSERGPLTEGSCGDVIRIVTAPPWIVVDHAKDSIIFTNWPGLLWKVEVLEPAPDSEQITDVYTRSKAVRLVETATASELFGAHGHAVEQVLSQAAQLELVQIASARPVGSDAVNAYSAAWNDWLKTHVPNEIQGDYRDTLGIGLRGYDSPIGRGFGVLFNVVDKRAVELEGDSAFRIDGNGEVYFSPQWELAFEAARFAAMACGAPEHLSERERRVLRENWELMMKAT